MTPLSLRKPPRPLPVFALAVAVASLASLLSICFVDDLSNDVATYYAPLAREFAGGNWDAAFHHIIPPLVPSLAGILAATGLSAFTALKIVSSGFYIAGLWPMRKLSLVVVPMRQASWACLLYAVTPRLMRYGGAGLLTSAKTFFLLSAAVLAVRYAQTVKLRYLSGLAICLALLALTRGEGIVFLPLFLVWVVVIRYIRGWRDRSLPSAGLRTVVGHSAVFLVLLGILLAPQVLYVYRVTGCPALDSRQTYVVQDLLGLETAEQNSPYPVARFVKDDQEEQAVFWQFAEETVEGLFPFYLLFGVAGIILLTRRRAWSVYHILFLAVIPYNVLIFALRGDITSRYLIPTVPFYLFLCAAALRAFYDIPWVMRHKKTVAALTSLVVLALAADGLLKVRSALANANNEKQVGRWIRQERDKFIKDKPVKLVSLTGDSEYHNGRQPIIASTDPQYSYWAAGDWCSLERDVLYSYRSLRDYVMGYHTDILVVNDHLLAVCPEFTARHTGDFRKVAHPGFDDVELYVPNRGP